MVKKVTDIFVVKMCKLFQVFVLYSTLFFTLNINASNMKQ